MLYLSRHGYFERVPFARPIAEFDVSVEHGRQLQPAELFRRPFPVGLMGAGFDKPARCTGLGGCKDLTIGLKSRGPPLPVMIQIQCLSQRLPGWVHMIVEVVKAPGMGSLIRVVCPSIHQCGRRLQRFFHRATQALSDSDWNDRDQRPDRRRGRGRRTKGVPRTTVARCSSRCRATLPYCTKVLSHKFPLPSHYIRIRQG
jgi:hypothetical protein